MDLIIHTKKGPYIPIADIYIDATRAVDKSIITHAHADHYKVGHKLYIATPATVATLRKRINPKLNFKTVAFGEEMVINGVKISLHPAGHILGSAQVRVEFEGEVWVITSDFKRHSDRITEPFELLKCNTLITETTFALPIYQWPDPEKIHQDINSWWSNNAEEGHVSIMLAYSLGKAQRILSGLNPTINKVYLHPLIHEMNMALNKWVDLPKFDFKYRLKPEDKGAFVLIPPNNLKRFLFENELPYKSSIASGWMVKEEYKARYGVQKGFVMSDHADWDELITTVKESGAERILTTHGYSEEYAKYLTELGYNSEVFDKK